MYIIHISYIHSKAFLSGILKSQRKKLQGRRRKHRKMSAYWEEHWAGYPRTQGLIWVLPVSTSVALTHCSAFLSIYFFSFMIGILVNTCPAYLKSSEGDWIECSIWKYTKYYKKCYKIRGGFVVVSQVCVLCPQDCKFLAVRSPVSHLFLRVQRTEKSLAGAWHPPASLNVHCCEACWL